MAASDLKQPLGQKEKKSFVTPKRFMIGSLSFLALLVFGLATWLLLTDEPNGGYPMQIVVLADGQSGSPMVGIDGIRPGIKPGVPEALSTAIRRPAPSNTPQTNSNQQGEIRILDPSDPSLSNLPGASNNTPLQRYARPVNSEAIAGLPKIAIIIDGLGLSQTTTQEALSLLPPDISLAFAPYGNGLDRWTRKARAQGHELLLQLPLEPFDYPNNDPGPHTLLTSASSEENKQNLRWLLSRFDSYVGVINYMGARFTADELAGTDLAKELSAEGLAYIDNGASGRSRMNDIANSMRLPNLRADYIIDARSRSQDIETRLIQLETLAQEKGKALGIATAFPISVRTITTWTQNLRQRGFALVPVTTLLKE